jgi:hypothetical protein
MTVPKNLREATEEYEAQQAHNPKLLGQFRISRVFVPFLLFAPSLAWAQAWSGYGHDPQHTATSAIAAQPLNSKHWCTPVDLNPPGGNGTLVDCSLGTGGGSGPLFVHYGSPVVTAVNTVIVPVTTASGAYQLQAFNGATGAPVYTASSCNTSGCYTPAALSWTQPYGPALSLGTRIYYPGPGGTLFYRSPDSPTSVVGQVAFYGTALYNANQAAFNSTVQITTPLTADRSGNIFFGFQVMGSNPASLLSGIARVSIAGTGTWKSAASLTGDSLIAYNAAPAMSNTQTTVYVATTDGSGGHIVSLNATTLAPIAGIQLLDPRPGYGAALVYIGSSAAPVVGPDGDVYFGVLEANLSSHNNRGWLLHFNSALTQTKTPGSFGWDDTPSVVPASAVPSYTGTSSYLILTKYNDYADLGIGNGLNQVAVLDPFATMPDQYNYGAAVATVMQEVITVTGVTPNSGLPGVMEWCINSAAVDPYTKAAIINSEDGTVYRWDFTGNTLSQSLNLTPGRGEAYTPTAIGPDGTVYAINDAILFAVGC